jgi:uncharacterized protein
MSAKNPTSSIAWFEIPVKNTADSIVFYNTILDTQLQEMKINNFNMGMFPSDGGTSGAVIDEGEPGKLGVTIYLDVEHIGIDFVLSKVEAAGGSIVLVKTKITDDIGFTSLIKDIDGNTIGLHEPPKA